MFFDLSDPGDIVLLTDESFVEKMEELECGINSFGESTIDDIIDDFEMEDDEDESDVISFDPDDLLASDITDVECIEDLNDKLYPITDPDSISMDYIIGISLF